MVVVQQKNFFFDFEILYRPVAVQYIVIRKQNRL